MAHLWALVSLGLARQEDVASAQKASRAVIGAADGASLAYSLEMTRQLMERTLKDAHATPPAIAEPNAQVSLAKSIEATRQLMERTLKDAHATPPAEPNAQVSLAKSMEATRQLMERTLEAAHATPPTDPNVQMDALGGHKPLPPSSKPTKNSTDRASPEEYTLEWTGAGCFEWDAFGGKFYGVGHDLPSCFETCAVTHKYGLFYRRTDGLCGCVMSGCSKRTDHKVRRKCGLNRGPAGGLPTFHACDSRRLGSLLRRRTSFSSTMFATMITTNNLRSTWHRKLRSGKQRARRRGRRWQKRWLRRGP